MKLVNLRVFITTEYRLNRALEAYRMKFSQCCYYHWDDIANYNIFHHCVKVSF